MFLVTIEQICEGLPTTFELFLVKHIFGEKSIGENSVGQNSVGQNSVGQNSLISRFTPNNCTIFKQRLKPHRKFSIETDIQL
jgi:hypothetical protein